LDSWTGAPSDVPWRAVLFVIFHFVSTGLPLYCLHFSWYFVDESSPIYLLFQFYSWLMTSEFSTCYCYSIISTMVTRIISLCAKWFIVIWRSEIHLCFLFFSGIICFDHSFFALILHLRSTSRNSLKRYWSYVDSVPLWKVYSLDIFEFNACISHDCVFCELICRNLSHIPSHPTKFLHPITLRNHGFEKIENDVLTFSTMWFPCCHHRRVTIKNMVFWAS
jgi:hypothetical protein